MRLPSFARQSETGTTDAERSPVPGDTTTPVRERRDTTVRQPTDATTTRWNGPSEEPPTADIHAEQRNTAPAAEPADRGVHSDEHRGREPKPRASLLATLSLILGVVSALLVLSGPLVGYGIGLAVLALILSFAGIHATGKRHVAGRTDALIGMVLALGAIVLGVLALTGSLNWLGTDTQPVNNVREWLDAQFVNRF